MEGRKRGSITKRHLYATWLFKKNQTDGEEYCKAWQDAKKIVIKAKYDA